MLHLTPDQIKMIKETWEIPNKDLEAYGEEIFYRFFKKYPHNQQKFVAFKDIDVEKLKGTKGMRYHSFKSMNTIRRAINAFDSDDVEAALEKVWNPIGVSHFHRHISKESFNEVRDVILEVTTDVSSLNEEQQKAWAVLLDDIYAIIFKKMDEMLED